MQDDFGPSAWVPSEDGRAFATVIDAEEAAAAGDSGETERLFREGIHLYREAGEGVDYALGRYGAFLLKEGRLDDAVAALGEAMEMGTDLGAIWSDYIAIQAQRHDMSGMFDTFDRLPPSVSEYTTITDWILPYVGRAVRAGDLEYGELLCRTVRDEPHSRNEVSGAFKAIGQHGQILEKMDRLDDAIDEWQSAFEAGSDDPTTVDRLGDVISVLNPGGTLAAAWCDGVLSFFAGDSIINSSEIDCRPGTLVPWGRDLLVVQGASVKVFDPAGRSVWALEFSKGIAGLSINDLWGASTRFGL